MDVTRIGDEFIARHDDLEFVIRGLRESGDGLSAVVRSFYNNGTRQSITAPTRINFYSSQGRGALAKALTAGRSVPGMDARAWEVITVNLCGHVAEAWEDGEPFVDLGDRPEPPMTTRHAFKGFLPAGETSVWPADGGSGKSTTGAALLLSYATGKEIIPGIVPADEGPVMLLDWESNEAEHLRRLHSIARAYGITIPKGRILYRRNRRAFADDISQFRLEVARAGVKLLLVDSAVPASDQDIKDTGAPTRLFNAAASLGDGVTRLILAHISKDAAQNGNGRARAIGSVMYDNLARSVIELVKSGVLSTRHRLVTGFFPTKVNQGYIDDPFGLDIAYDPETQQPTRFTRIDIREVPDLRDRLPLTDRLLDFLRWGARSTPEIAQEFEITTAAATKMLKRRKEVIELERGGGKGKSSKWGLSGEPAPSQAVTGTYQQAEDEWWT